MSTAQWNISGDAQKLKDTFLGFKKYTDLWTSAFILLSAGIAYRECLDNGTWALKSNYSNCEPILEEKVGKCAINLNWTFIFSFFLFFLSSFFSFFFSFLFLSFFFSFFFSFVFSFFFLFFFLSSFLLFSFFFLFFFLFLSFFQT